MKKNLVDIINSEVLSFEDRILYFDPYKGEVDRDYFVYWTMEGRKTIWNSGNILLVYNDRILDSFRSALNLKYKIDLSSEYDAFLAMKLNRSLREEDCRWYRKF